MIVRILNEGQWEVDESELTELNKLDDEVEAAIEQGDEVAFTGSLAALLSAVRERGTPLPVDSLEDSDLILPPSDASLAEVRELLGEEGLIPD